MTLPVMSVMVTIVLLKVERMCAIPECTFLLPFALMIFGFSTSPSSNDNFSGAAAAGASSFPGLAFFAGLVSAAGAFAGAAAAAVSAGAGAGGVSAVGVSAGAVSATGALLLAASVFFGVFFESAIDCQWLDFAGFGVLVANDTDCLARSFPGSSIG